MGSTVRMDDCPAFAVGYCLDGAASNILLTGLASGCVPIDQLITMPSKQSMIGDRYTLPAGIWNSVMSVSHFSFGVFARKSRLIRFSGAGLISPRYEPKRRRRVLATTKRSCFINRCTTFSDTVTLCQASNACCLR